MLEFELLNSYLAYFAGNIMLSTGQRSVLETSLTVTKHQMHFKKMFFWGRINGVQADYFIAQGISGGSSSFNDSWYNRKTLFSQDCINWALLNPTTDDMRKMAGRVSTVRLTGDLSDEIDVPKPHLDTEFGCHQGDTSLNDEVVDEVVKMKEEDRLAAVISLIDEATTLVPRGAFIREASGQLVENRLFQGLRGEEAGKLCNYFHLRFPTHLFSETLLDRADLEPSIDFLDTAFDELPTSPGSTWALQYERGGSHVVVRSLLWPGYAFFHVPGTQQYGSLYEGPAILNQDLPFML